MLWCLWVDNPFLMHGFALLEWKEKNHEGARALLMRALSFKPRDIVVYQSWAAMEGEVGNLDTAEVIFKEAYARVPKKKCAALLQSWGLFEERRGNPDRARLLYLKSIQTDVRHAHAYCAWGIMESKLDKHDRAREIFLRGIRADPWSVHMLHAWANMEAKLGNNDRAAKLLGECVRIDPSNIQALDRWEKLVASSGGDEAEAKEQMDYLSDLKQNAERSLQQARDGAAATEAAPASSTDGEP